MPCYLLALFFRRTEREGATPAFLLRLYGSYHIGVDCFLEPEEIQGWDRSMKCYRSTPGLNQACSTGIISDQNRVLYEY